MSRNLKLVSRIYTSLYGICMSASLIMFTIFFNTKVDRCQQWFRTADMTVDGQGQKTLKFYLYGL